MSNDDVREISRLIEALEKAHQSADWLADQEGDTDLYNDAYDVRAQIETALGLLRPYLDR